MKTYQKPTMEIQSFLSQEHVAAGSLEDFLKENSDFSNAGIETYSVTSVNE